MGMHIHQGEGAGSARFENHRTHRPGGPKSTPAPAKSTPAPTAAPTTAAPITAAPAQPATGILLWSAIAMLVVGAGVFYAVKRAAER
ncbi:hypothetical protein A6A07_39570 [Streptomyces sp. CB03911]|nr:hypothetical protein A6A07_39570 [Streptomyces sp. CB03911]